ncbi:hypothetical protein PGC35_19375 [Psychrobacillus sp. PGGUH221]|uniref:hypothetical protein n=1 Tax=Psychrobacillus sp. PGGUH221 TaxID=3020058 RepID=UPI0035C6E82F
MQKEFDTKHGWSLQSGNTSEKLEVISKDIIGLMGELGEFSNIIKKLNLTKDIYKEE